MVRWLPHGYEQKPPARIWAGGVYREALSRVWQNEQPSLRFVIIAKGRSGSTLLTTSLDSHPDIVCADEILNRPQIDAVRYAARYARRKASRGFGFHIKPGQAKKVQGFRDLTAYADQMISAGWKIIHLQRRDVVAQYISILHGLQNQEWHRSEKATSAVSRISVNVDAFVRQIAKRTAGLGKERAALAPFAPFSLTYDDDLQDADTRATRLEDLQQWLGLSVYDLRSPLRKIGTRDPLDLLENADEVRAALQREGLIG